MREQAADKRGRRVRVTPYQHQLSSVRRLGGHLGIWMRFVSPRSFLILILMCHFFACGEAAFTVSSGGCGIGTSGYVIHSDIDNERAAQFLADSGIAFAILPGTVVEGTLHWDNGDAVTWMPSTFFPPPATRSRLVLRRNGAWAIVATSLSGTYLCSDGKPDSITTTTTTTPAPLPNTTTTTPAPLPNTTTTTPAPLPNTTTTTPAPLPNTTTTTPAPLPNTTTTTPAPLPNTTTTTPAPLPNTTTTTPAPLPNTTTIAPQPEPAVVTVPVLLQSLKREVFDVVPSIDIMDFTSNAVCLPATAALVQNMQRLKAGHVVIAVRFGHAGPLSSLTTDPTANTVGFQIPLGLYNVTSSVQHAMSLVTLTASGSIDISTKLRIIPVLDVFQRLPTGVVLLQENVLNGLELLSTVRFAGRNTIVPFTTDVSLMITSTLSFSMVNNGILGGACNPSSSSIAYFITRNSLQFHFPTKYAERVHSGRKSICASYGERDVVVAPLTIRGLAAVTAMTAEAGFSAFEGILIDLLGGTTTGMAKGEYQAFMANSHDCTSVKAAVSLLPVNSFVGINDDALALPAALLLADDQVRPGEYVCMQHIPSNTKFAVSQKGEPVTASANSKSLVAGAKASPLILFNGSSGVVNLVEFVRPAADAGDTAAFTAARALVGEEHQVFRFVAVRGGATNAEKAAACRRAPQEATLDSSNGFMRLSFPLYLKEATGILCADNQYVRVDYNVVSPQGWLESFAGRSISPSRTLVLSEGPAFDAVPINAGVVTNSSTTLSPVSGTAVMFSKDGSCTFGHISRILTYGALQFVVIPTTSFGIFTVCAGLYNESGTSLFVSTGAQVAMAPYLLGRSNWIADTGIDSTEWTPCGSAATCGFHTEQEYMEVCNGVVRTNMWPARLDGAFVGSGSLTLRMSGNLYETQAIVLMNTVFVPVAVAYSHCQQLSLLPLSADDGLTYGPAVVVLDDHPQITLSPATDLSGVVVGLVSWDATCRSPHTGADLMVARSATGVSAIDVGALLFTQTEGYYTLCVYNGKSWARVTDTFLKVTSYTTATNRAEAINTGDAVTNRNIIHLYETQTATWSVIGIFADSMMMTLKLVWDDPSCTADAAYTEVIHYLSPNSGIVTVDAARISAAPASLYQPKLYPCYTERNTGTVASPLPFEQHRDRFISLTRLTLSSLYYLPHFPISASSLADTRILLTDPSDPPITRVALQAVDSKDGAPQCTSGAAYVTVLDVDVDELGRRWLTVPAWVPQTLGGTGATDIYLKMCATASSSAYPPFVPVEAYVVLGSEGVDLAKGPMTLRFTFAPLNATTDVVDYVAAQAALVSYVGTVLSIPDETVLVASLGDNSFELFIDDRLRTGVAAAESSMTPTQQLYDILSKGVRLPLIVNGHDNATAWFALATVEGVLLVDQSPVKGYGVLMLPTSGSGSSSRDYFLLSIALFCVVVAPTTIGFVAFSVQQTLPTLSHAPLGKKKLVYTETGDSPPPRNPQRPAEREPPSANTSDTKGDTVLSVLPRAEDTTLNPLYDSDEEGSTHEMQTMGKSPPLRNDTFAMAHRRESSLRSSASGEKR